MTVNEIIKSFEGQYTDVDVYTWAGRRHDIHTDTIKVLDEHSGDESVATYQLMDKEDYSSSILANSSIAWDDMYGEEDKVLVIVIDDKPTWGGRRAGAGRKASLPDGAKPRSIKCTKPEFKRLREYLTELRAKR